MEQPKYPISSYNHFQACVYPQIKKDFSELNHKELHKKCGEMWRFLEDKSKWINMGVDSKKQYEDDMIEFKRQGGVVKVKAKKSQKGSSKKSDAELLSQYKKSLKSREVVNQASLMSLPRIVLRRIDNIQDSETPFVRNTAAAKTSQDGSKASNKTKTNQSNNLKSNMVVNTASLLRLPRINLREPNDTSQDSDASAPVDDTSKLPIFNHGFLTHNKTAEAELKTLRGALTDAQLEEIALTTYNEKLVKFTRKMEDNTQDIQHSIEQMENYLAQLKAKIVVDLKMMSSNSTENIVNHIKDLSSEEKLRKEPETVQQAQNILSKM